MCEWKEFYDEYGHASPDAGALTVKNMVEHDLYPFDKPDLFDDERKVDMEKGSNL